MIKDVPGFCCGQVFFYATVGGAIQKEAYHKFIPAKVHFNPGKLHYKPVGQENSILYKM